MRNKVQFPILTVFQNAWDLHKFGLQIWIQNAKITLWKNFRQFFRFHRFRSSGPRMRSKVIFQYKLYFKMYGIYINLGCRFEFRTQKLPYERISVNFSSFIDFGHQVLFWILAVFQNVWDLHNFSEHKNYPMKEFRQFFRFHRFWSSGVRNKVIFNVSCISKCMRFT